MEAMLAGSTTALYQGHAWAMRQGIPRPKALKHRPITKQTTFTCKASKNSEDKPDFIERAFGALFGNKALGATEPFGMKRMSDEAYNEQSLATTTELAEPVEGDNEEVALLRPLLAKTRLEKLPLRWAHVCSC